MWPSQEPSSNVRSELSQPRISEESSHGMTLSDDPACCRKEAVGLVDCQACVENECANFVSSLSGVEADIAKTLFDALNDAGSRGIPKDRLLVCIPLYLLDCVDVILQSCLNPPQEVDIFALVEKMTRTSVPIVFWAGYVSVVLVSALHLPAWTVVVTEDPLKRVFPRRWIDIKGGKLVDVWEAAVRAIVGLVIFRPGITQVRNNP